MTLSANIIARESQISVEALVERSAVLRKELAPLGLEVDRDNIDVGSAMQRCYEESLSLLSLPKKYGGMFDGEPNYEFEAFSEITTNLGASDGALAQVWATAQMTAREIFHPESEGLFSEEARQEIADVMRAGPIRLAAANSETGSPKKVVARRVPGGIRVDGVKTFCSGSGGGGFALSMVRDEDGRPLRALIRLDAEGVGLQNNWDNMGQRGTQSQSIAYDDVFVPEGWFHTPPPMDPRVLPMVFVLHSAFILGNAVGALDTVIDHLRSTNRVMIGGEFKTSEQDPMMMGRLGDMSSKIRSAFVFQQSTARDIELLKRDDDVTALQVDAIRSKAVTVPIAIETTQKLFDMLGARATANKYRNDRYWRNARTFSCHDPLDILNVTIGRYELNQQPPNFMKTYGYLME